MKAVHAAAWVILLCLFAVDPQAGPVNWGAWCLLLFAAGLVAWITYVPAETEKKAPGRAGTRQDAKDVGKDSPR